MTVLAVDLRIAHEEAEDALDFHMLAACDATEGPCATCDRLMDVVDDLWRRIQAAEGRGPEVGDG